MRLSQDLSKRSEKFLLIRYPVYVGSFLAINHNAMTYIGWTVTKNVDESITELFEKSVLSSCQVFYMLSLFSFKQNSVAEISFKIEN